jgi:hypothetical protein
MLSCLRVRFSALRSSGPRFLASLLVASSVPVTGFCFGAVAASAQNLIVDAPTALPVGGTVNLGTVGQYGEYTDALGFHFDQSIKITAVSYDPGLGGVQELTAESLVGSSCFQNQQLPAGSECHVETGILPKFPGLRTGTLRIVTTSGTYLLPVSYTATMTQAAVTPGTPTAAVPGQTVSVAGNSLAIDSAGNLYLGASGDSVVREINATTGAVTIFAGTLNDPNDSGDGGPATAAAIQYPIGTTVSPAGDLYIVSSFPLENDTIRKVQAGTGIISTAGGIASGRPLGGRGEPQPGTPIDGSVAVDENGTMFVSVPYLNEMLEITAAGTTTDIIGNAAFGSTCNATPAYVPISLTVSGGYVYFYSQNAVFKMSTDTSQCQPVVPVAGTGTTGFSGNGGAATSAQIGSIGGIAVDAAGDVYLADGTNGVLWFISASTGNISSIAGLGSPLPSVSVGGGLPLDARGNLYVLSAAGTVQKIDVSTGTLQFLSTIVGDTSADSPQSVTVSNIGNASFVPGAATVPTGFGFNAGSTCLQSGTTIALAQGASCGVGFDFTPGLPGNIAGSSTLFGETVQLSGTASAPASTTTANVSPTVINFGSVSEGNVSGTWSINVANTGASKLTLSAATLSDTTNFVLGGNCATIAPYSSCNLTVAFKPQTSGAITGTLTLTDNATPGTQVISLSGTALYARPVLNVSPGSINFGSVQVGTTSAAWSVNVANTGGLPMTLATNILTDAAEFSYTGNCGAVVAAYSSCELSVVFTPQAAGNPSSAVVISTNATGGAFLLPIAGTGVGQPPPVVQLSPSSINFGSVTKNNSSGTWTIFVGNTGGSPLTIGSIVLSDTTDFVLGGNCGAAVAAYSSCSETVTFKPQTTGTIQGTIAFTDNAGTGTQTVSLTGKATKPNYKLSVTPSSLTVRRGEVGQATFNFTPVQGFTGTVTLACGGLPANASCTFSPATLTSDGSGTAQTAQIAIATTGTSTTAMSPNGGGNSSAIAFASLLGFNGLLFGFGRLRRKASRGLKMLALALLLCVGLAGTGGCAGAALSSLAASGTQTLGLTATTTGTAGTDSQTAVFTLTITQ